ncbi:hypothetical protein HS088_TW18G00742 [Tripterygium wilfordii]|uniref:Uncharacterized protein n=1 Tax=Tripterygium wilfordii TaxID=458696 RepID=A0A7J7CD53_TRIWF|nr:hypothetical protein HS088_TW18G00742 [Tripterygium wilfordii]
MSSPPEPMKMKEQIHMDRNVDLTRPFIRETINSQYIQYSSNNTFTEQQHLQPQDMATVTFSSTITGKVIHSNAQKEFLSAIPSSKGRISMRKIAGKVYQLTQKPLPRTGSSRFFIAGGQCLELWDVSSQTSLPGMGLSLVRQYGSRLVLKSSVRVA